MRPLTEEETKIFFEKLTKYIGENIKLLLERADGVYCFRLHKDRVYYVSEKIMKQVGLELLLNICYNLLSRLLMLQGIISLLWGHVLESLRKLGNFGCISLPLTSLPHTLSIRSGLRRVPSNSFFMGTT